MVDANLDKFVADTDQVDLLLTNFKVPAPVITIDTSQAVTDFDDHFSCTICCNVVIDPKEC